MLQPVFGASAARRLERVRSHRSAAAGGRNLIQGPLRQPVPESDVQHGRTLDEEQDLGGRGASGHYNHRGHDDAGPSHAVRFAEEWQESGGGMCGRRTARAGRPDGLRHLRVSWLGFVLPGRKHAGRCPAGFDWGEATGRPLSFSDPRQPYGPVQRDCEEDACPLSGTGHSRWRAGIAARYCRGQQ